MAPATGNVYVAPNGSSAHFGVAVVNAGYSVVNTTITGSLNYPAGVAVSPSNGAIYVTDANGGGHSVAVISQRPHQ